MIEGMKRGGNFNNCVELGAFCSKRHTSWRLDVDLASTAIDG
jgi:hypothetical protein